MNGIAENILLIFVALFIAIMCAGCKSDLAKILDKVNASYGSVGYGTDDEVCFPIIEPEEYKGVYCIRRKK